MLFYRPWSVRIEKIFALALECTRPAASVRTFETLGKVFLEADHPVNISINLDIPVTI